MRGGHKECRVSFVKSPAALPFFPVEAKNFKSCDDNN